MKTKMMCLLLLGTLSINALAEVKQVGKATTTVVITRHFDKINADGKSERVIDVVCEKKIQTPIYQFRNDTTEPQLSYDPGVICDSLAAGRKVKVHVLPLLSQTYLSKDKLSTRYRLAGRFAKTFGGIMTVQPGEPMISGGISPNIEAEVARDAKFKNDLQKPVETSASILDSNPGAALITLTPHDSECTDSKELCMARERFEAHIIVEDKK